MTQSDQDSFWWLARRPSVVKRASKIALIVGIVLAFINHGDAIISGNLTTNTLTKIALTFCVPYCVSTYSSILAIRDKSQLIAGR